MNYYKLIFFVLACGVVGGLLTIQFGLISVLVTSPLWMSIGFVAGYSGWIDK